ENVSFRISFLKSIRHRASPSAPSRATLANLSEADIRGSTGSTTKSIANRVLLVAVAFAGFRMLLTILLAVIPVRLPPLLLTRPHILGVGGIAVDSFAVIVAAPPALAIRLATDALLWSITGRLKNLLAVSAA